MTYNEDRKEKRQKKKDARRKDKEKFRPLKQLEPFKSGGVTTKEDIRNMGGVFKEAAENYKKFRKVPRGY